MKSLIFTIQEYINQFLFSSSCIECQKPGLSICRKCLLSIPFADTTENEGIYGIYDYGNSIVSHAIWNLKYKHKGQEAKILTNNSSSIVSEIIAEHLQSEKPETINLVPIPQYKNKTNRRGFNQSEQIAIWLSKNLPNSKVLNILEKIKQTIPQSHISDKNSRIKNISGAMRVKPNIDNKKIYIIVDDVTTTGATFLEAKRALNDLGAKNILCIALAHGYKRR